MSYDVEYTERGEQGTLDIWRDDTAESPRKDRDNLATLYFWHRHYALGDFKNAGDPAEVLRALKRAGGEVLWVSMIDHSGIALREARGPGDMAWPEDPGGWDSGIVGFFAVTRERARREWPTGPWRKKAREQMRAELRELDQYVQGDVYGYTVRDARGAVLDSCGGFYGFDYAEEEAKRAAQVAWRQEQEGREEAARIGVPTV